jgi:hypothetical protein
MKRALVSIVAAFFVVVVVVPGDARADTDAEMMEKVVQVLERVATIVDMNKSDCNAMGDKLTAVIDEKGVLLAAAKARADALSPAEKQALEARFGARVRAAAMKLQPGLRACGSNPKVLAAVQRVRQ